MRRSLRLATMRDARRLYNWRNDPVVRAASFQTREIPYPEHIAYLTEMLRDAERVQYILSVDGKPAGQIRLRFCEKDALEISYSVAKAFRGKGLGTWLLVHIAPKAKRRYPKARVLIGRVKPENTASRRAFLAAGYEEVSKTKKEVVFRKLL